MALDQVRLRRFIEADRESSSAHGKIELAVVEAQHHLDARIALDEFLPENGP